MASILKKAANYKRISTILCEGEAHLRDPLTPPPVILKVFLFFFKELFIKPSLSPPPQERRENLTISPISRNKRWCRFPSQSLIEKESTDQLAFL